MSSVQLISSQNKIVSSNLGNENVEYWYLESAAHVDSPLLGIYLVRLVRPLGIDSWIMVKSVCVSTLNVPHSWSLSRNHAIWLCTIGNQQDRMYVLD